MHRGADSLAPLPQCLHVHSYLSAEPGSCVCFPSSGWFFAPWHLAVPPPQTRNAVHPQAGAEIQPLCVSQVVPSFLVASLGPAADERCWHRAALTSVLLRALPSIPLAEGAHGGRRWLSWCFHTCKIKRCSKRSSDPPARLPCLLK